MAGFVRIPVVPLERHVSVQSGISPVSSAEMAADNSEQVNSGSERMDENSQKTLDNRRKSYLTPHYSFRHGGPTPVKRVLCALRGPQRHRSTE